MRLLPLTKLFLCAFCILTLSSCSFDTYKRNYHQLHEPRYSNQQSVKRTELKNGTIKVVSYNIKHGKKLDLAIKIIDENLSLKDADIMLLQELDAHAAEKLAKELDYNYVYYPSALHPVPRKDLGNAIFSKWPILSDQKIILPHLDPYKLQRIAVNATIEINHRRVMVYCVHMDVFLSKAQRDNQMSRIIHSIPPSVKHVIVGGDFNTVTQFNLRGIRRPLEAAGFTFASEKVGWTYKHWYLLKKKSSLDHIFAKGLHSLAAGKVNDRRASDHLPIWVDLTFDPL